MHPTIPFVELIALDPGLVLDLRYATPDNVLGRPLYDEARAFLGRPAALALVAVQRDLAATDLGLVIFDAYRPLSVTRALWEGVAPACRRFVADPARGSRHNRGGAVDVGLRGLPDGHVLSMPSEFDTFDETAAADWPGGTAEERRNRDRLRVAMTRRGFRVNPDEWWHFDFDGSEAWPVLDLPFAALAGATP